MANPLATFLNSIMKKDSPWPAMSTANAQEVAAGNQAQVMAEAPVPTDPSQAAATIAPTAPSPTTTRSSSVEAKFVPESVQSKLDAIRARMDALSQANAATEQAGIDDYQKMIQQQESAPSQYSKYSPDLSALAPLVDSWAGGNVAQATAAAVKPEDKKAALAAMKEKLQSMKSGLSKSQYQNLKDQLDSYNEQIKLKAAEAANKGRMGGTDERFLKRQLADYGSKVRPLMVMNNAFKKVEDGLGFNINEYDPIKGTVRGEKTDVPGVNLPILGRINQANPQSRQFKSKLAALTNIILKERSGASVTTTEQARIMDEFANGRFKFNTEADLLAALQDFSRSLEADIEDVGAAYDADIPIMYDENQANRRETFQREPGVKSAAPSKSEVMGRTKALEDMTDEEMIAYENSLKGK